MSMYSKTLRSDAARAFLSLPFVLALISCAGALAAGSWSYLLQIPKGWDEGVYSGFHQYMVLEGMRSEVFLFLLPIISALPFAGAYLEDMQYGFLRFFLIRSDRAAYAAGKVLINALAGGAASLGGTIIYYVISFYLVFPFESGVWGLGDGWLMLLGQLPVVFLCGTFFAAVSGLMAVLYRNRYLVYMGAFLFSYLSIIIVTRYIPYLYIINPREWLTNAAAWPLGEWGVILFLLQLTAVTAGIQGAALYKHIQNR